MFNFHDLPKLYIGFKRRRSDFNRKFKECLKKEAPQNDELIMMMRVMMIMIMMFVMVKMWNQWLQMYWTSTHMQSVYMYRIYSYISDNDGDYDYNDDNNDGAGAQPTQKSYIIVKHG